MKNFLKICLFLIGAASTAGADTIPQYGRAGQLQVGYYGDNAGNPPATKVPGGNVFIAKSSGFPSIDFVKRFGKHCTSHRNMIGRSVNGLCDDVGVCNPEQYKACYKNCIQDRKKEDEKTMYIFQKLAACKVDRSDKNLAIIQDQAVLRINQAKRTQIKSQTFTTDADSYKAQRAEGVRDIKKSYNPLSANCTSHKNKFGFMTKGICDADDRCKTAKYKKCYSECVLGRPVDYKTFAILKQLVTCRVNESDLELGDIAKEVHKKYNDYEISQASTLLRKTPSNSNMGAAGQQQPAGQVRQR
ncbi:hypothetical protein [Candidatus Paracaedibacter symbiosus]|uniref:hypothetical protein n=1 Tax=Candidatus Paracaedibacter symbiosus TaxID=244582 RepID=UPI000509FEE0|nr:hypothetical protein [Candidatus Paracaedibacter symbiosus]